MEEKSLMYKIDKARQFIAFGASVIVAVQICVILIEGSAICPNAGCELVEKQTTITPLGVNILGLLFFQAVFWLMRWQDGREKGDINWANGLLLAGLAAETVFLSYQLFVVKAFCGYCLLILFLVLLLNLLSGKRQVGIGTATAVAILVGFSLLRFSPAAGSSEKFSLKNGSYGTRTCVNPSKRIYLIFSEDCPHCVKVIRALDGCSSCELHLNPIDRIDDLQFSDLKQNSDYSPEINRSVLSMFGIGEIPVLVVDNHDGFQFIKGTRRIIDYISHACFMQEPSLYFDRSQFSDQENITAFSLDDGECSVEIDCNDPHIPEP
jgi:uncharacterized membrane protein/glutaredoxin